MTGLGSSTSEIAAAVREISATSKQLASTMSEVNERSNHTAKLAASGRAGLATMLRVLDAEHIALRAQPDAHQLRLHALGLQIASLPVNVGSDIGETKAIRISPLWELIRAINPIRNPKK